MRRAWAVLLLLPAACPAGCVSTRPERSPSLFEARRVFQGPAGDDVVQFQVALTERPAGDRGVNEELWQLVDDEGVGFDRKQVLKDNGLRVCQIGGQPPAALQRLLASSKSNPDPRGLSCRAGKPITLPIGPVLPRCSFLLVQDGEPVPVDLDQAQCQVEVVPHLTDDNRIRLRFTPQIKHGPVKQKACPVHAPSGVLEWGQRWEQDEEDYPALAWELTVNPNEFVVVGTMPGREETLGQQFFVRAEESRAVQRLLVLRVARAAPASPAPEFAGSSKAPPLASRAAGLPSVRGSAP